jgi:protein-tyrosine phosphatase
VLVVCYGNIYRSPYVGEYLRQRAAAAFDVRTAGFHSKTGRPSPPEHVAMCAVRGVSLASHRSTLADPALLEWADTIVLMDRRNWLALDAAGAAGDRLVWLGALDGGALEIPDPYGLSPEEAARIVERLTRASDVFLETQRS